MAKGKRIQVDLPATHLTEKEKIRYNSFIAKAIAHEKKLLKSKLFKKALRNADVMDNGDREKVFDGIVGSINKIVPLFVMAVEMCDEDVSLHRKLYYYKQLLTHSSK